MAQRRPRLYGYTGSIDRPPWLGTGVTDFPSATGQAVEPDAPHTLGNFGQVPLRIGRAVLCRRVKLTVGVVVTQGPTWRVEQVRLSVLGNVSAAGHAPAFHKIFGLEPDFSGEKPKEGTRIEEGQWHGRAVLVQQSRDRIDAILRPNVMGPNLPDAGTLEEVQHFFTCWPPNENREQLRLACGVSLHVRTDSQTANVNLLQRLVPTLQLPPDATDVIYQLNRRIPSKAVSGVNVNRLLKWSTVQAVFFRLDGVGKTQVAAGPPDAYLVQLEIDVNTDRPVKLTSDSKADLQSELVSIALDLAANGMTDADA